MGMVGCGAAGVAALASGKERGSAYPAPTASQGPGELSGKMWQVVVREDDAARKGTGAE